jgi:cation:H+ antiporter
MSIPVALLLFLAGLAVVFWSAERLVEGVVATAAGFGLSAFLVSVVLVGFDPENLFVGGAGALEGAHGIALGSVIGSAMVAVGLALGITGLLVPLAFEKVPWHVVLVAPLAILGAAALAKDGRLSRPDGAVLLVGYAVAIASLAWTSGRGLTAQPAVMAAEDRRTRQAPRRGRALGLLVVSIAGLAVGSTAVVQAAGTVVARFGISETVFGMTILALAVSVEELARDLPAALRGHPEIVVGNVVGSVLAFFLFNAGAIALLRPIVVEDPILDFYLPVTFATVMTVSFFLWRGGLPRWGGGVLVLFYLVFAVGGFLL